MENTEEKRKKDRENMEEYSEMIYNYIMYFNNYISYKSLPPFYFPNLSTIQLTFLPYFQNHFIIQLTFLPYFPYLFTIQLIFLPYFPNLITENKMAGKGHIPGKYGKKES
jgi:hypothetical protein